MPKVKWGSGVTADDIENAEVREGFTPYSGPTPPAGVYRFRLSQMKTGVSGTGNPKLFSIWHIDGSWKTEHKKYDGAPLFDHMPVTKETAWRVKAFAAALGITSADFLNKMVVDEDQKVTKIGKLVIDSDLEVYISVKRERDDDRGDRIVLQAYLSPPDEDDEEADEESDDDSGEDTPF